MSATQYRITDRSLSGAEDIELNEIEYSDLLAVRDALAVMLGAEQKLDLLLENYTDYERVLLDLALRSAVFIDRKWENFQSEILSVVRRLVNLLSAARLYLDQVTHDLSSISKLDHSVCEAVEARRAAVYDGSLGYRVMETLRNVVQHRSINFLSLSIKQTRGKKPTGARTRVRAVPAMSVSDLREAGLKASVMKELEKEGDRVALTPLVREYVAGLFDIHETLRKEASASVTVWDEEVESLCAHCADGWGLEPTRPIFLVRLDEKGKLLNSTSIFPQLATYRRDLQKKNSALGHLSMMYVSGETEEGDTS